MRDTSSGHMYRDAIVDFIHTELADLSLRAVTKGVKSEITISRAGTSKIMKVLCMSQDVRGTAEQKIDSKLGEIRKTPGAAYFLYRGDGYSLEGKAKLTAASEAIHFDIGLNQTTDFVTRLRRYFT